MPRLILATRNAHKTREVREILGARFEVEDLSALPGLAKVEETGATFEENAVLKAVAASRSTDALVLADDSGLEVDALGGAPGVRSARYAGEPCDDARNCARLLEALAEIAPRDPRRSARFRCVIAVALRGGNLATFAGSVEGTIAAAPRGRAGFGYDPLFIPAGYTRTFAELPREVKQRESHRARALALAAGFLAKHPAQ